MIRYGLILFIVIVTSVGCTTSGQQDEPGKKSVSWSFSKNDLNKLPKANYRLLTQVYDEESLENREVTFRDERLLTLRDKDTYFCQMPSYKNKEAWEKRKKYLKEHILICSGLWPMPEKTPLHPVYYHNIDHSDYVVETVTIETYPGFYLGGNIYRPKGKGPYPAILTPYGHWKYGRLTNTSTGSIPARCINLARQGYVVFTYDMVGYDDTRQASHTFADDSLSRLYGINLLGLQLWNSIRALDFLLSLPGVDTSRVGITGASGGGTQTYMLTAVDDRFQAAAPVNMVSNNMQGGSLCENAPGLRTNTFNVEIAAMIAPKPLLLVSNTHDWTYNTRNTIMPMMRSVYHLYHADDKLSNRHFDFVHNYNKASRDAVYQFFGKWLLHDKNAIKIREKPVVADSDKYLLAFMNARNADHTLSYEQMPSTAYHDLPNHLNEKDLKALLKSIYTRQLNNYWPENEKELQTFKSIYGTALRHLLEADMPKKTTCKIIGKSKGQGFIATRLLIARKDQNDWIPCILYQPLSKAKATVIATADQGKSHWVAQGQNTPDELIRSLLNQKYNVLTPDLFKQGEHLLQDSTKTRKDEKIEYFTTYNLTDRQNQIQDLLTIIRFINESDDLSHDVDLYATGNTGLTGLLLAPITQELDKIVINGNRFDPTTDENMLTLHIPGIMRIGGMKTVLALAANKHLLLYNADTSFLTSGVVELSKLENNEGHFIITSSTVEGDKVIGFLKL